MLLLEFFPPQLSNQEFQKDRANWLKFLHLPQQSPLPPSMSLVLTLPAPNKKKQKQKKQKNQQKNQFEYLPFNRCQKSVYRNLDCTFFLKKHCTRKPDFTGDSFKKTKKLWKNNLDLREQFSSLLVGGILGTQMLLLVEKWGEERWLQDCLFTVFKSPLKQPEKASNFML